MLRRISVENFYSIAERQTLDLTVGRKVDNPEIFSLSGDTYVNRAAVIFGNNASGKTNFLKAFWFLKFMINDSGRQLRPDQLLPHAPFQPPLNESDDQSSIDVEFDFRNIPYRYHISFNRQHIISESLHFAPSGQRYRRLFDRNLQTFRGSKDFSLTASNNIFPRVGPNAAFLSIASMLHHRPSIDLLSSPLNIETDVGKSGKLSYAANKDMIQRSSLFYSTNIACFNLMADLILKSDVGIKQINIEEEHIIDYIDDFPNLEPFNNEVAIRFDYLDSHFSIKFIHSNGSVREFKDQSGGTQALYVKSLELFFAIQSGGIAALDEIDSDIHPSNLMLLLNLFRSGKTNPKNAQLIMSAHSVSLLQELEKEEIFFAEKDERGASQIYSLKDIQGVRRVDNFYAKYMTGAYGALPHS